MTHLLIFIFLSVWQHRSIGHISRHNLARKEAESAYLAGDYKTAADRYTYLNKSAGDGTIKLNAGHAYFQLKQFGKAKEHYETVLQEQNAALASIAAIQLGVIACYEQDSASALTLFRQALLQDPNSEPARYNFELIKRQYSGKRPPEKQPSARNKTTQLQAASSSSTQSGGKVERSDREEEQLKRFSELNMTEEQALQLLDAMQGNDLPYSSLRPFQGGRANRSAQTRNKNRW